MLLRKMWRDLLQNKVQFFSIFLLSLLGIFVFAGLDSEASGMAKYESLYYEETDLADMWVQGKKFKNEDLNKIRAIPGVVTAEKRLRIDGKAELEEEHDLQMNFIDSNEISRMRIIKGEPFEPGEGGVWLEQTFAEHQGLDVGDTIKMKVEGSEFDEKIRAIVCNPEYVYFLPDAAALMPTYGDYGAAFMDSAEYPVKDEIYFNQIIADIDGVDNTGGLDDDEKERVRRIGNTIRNVLDDSRIVTTGKDADLSYQTFHSEIEQHKTMTYIFPAVFLLIAILGIITTMTRMTSRQRIQIGTMKALGFSKRTVVMHYASYSLFLSLTGGIVGAILGYNTIAELIISMQSDAYLVPEMKTAFSPRAFGGIVVSVLVSTLVSYIACRKELAPAPAETLRPASPKNLKHSALEKSRLWLKLDFAMQWNIRDILRNKVRSAMGMFGVLGCAMLLFGAFACLDTMDFITTWLYGELNTSNYQIIMEENTPLSVTEEYAKEYSGQMVQNSGAEFEVNGVRKSGSVTVYDTGNYLHFEDSDMKHINLNKKGISMSCKMAEILGLEEGDVFRWHVIGDDKWQTSHVAGLYRNPTTQGITMTRDVFEELEYDFTPGAVYSNKRPKTSVEDDDYVTGVQSLEEMMEAFDSMKEMMYTMVYILVAAAIVLGVVVLYNLGVLSLVEKHREMATLKVLGFTSAKIRSILQMQNILLTLAGIVLGIPCGMGLIAALFGSMPESMDYIATWKPASFAYTIAGTLILSCAVNRILSRKVLTVDMVDALKGQE
ncbi:MAG: ABC transporter permease [Lachnospiraceae bacterium]|nr:ABC transporter permease [Lachnospiraceae bacterium]